MPHRHAGRRRVRLGLSRPGAGTGAPRRGGDRLVVIISASAEWKWVRSHFTGVGMRRSPYGEWFETSLAGASRPPVIFFHGGYGKVSAAGSTQYVIDRFRPSLLVNLGTCGGFEGSAEVGDIILVRETVIYDIIERMGDPAETLAHYSATLDIARWPAQSPFPRPHREDALRRRRHRPRPASPSCARAAASPATGNPAPSPGSPTATTCRS